MLLHITPRLYLPIKPKACAIVSLEIEELGVHLGGDQLHARKPYPNKHYLAACRRIGHKAIEGLFIETSRHVPKFEVVAQWDIDGTLVEHRTNYQVLDDQHPAVSDNMLFWSAHSTGIDTAVYSDRRPEPASLAPCFAAPRMEFYNKQRVNSDDPDYSRDSISSDGNFILKRVMDFAMPSLERSRLVNPMLSRRMPSIGDAFRANC